MSNSKNSEGISEAALSVVNIIATNSSNSSGYRMRGNQEIVGSGIIISDDGYIITNLHIIDRKKEINVELEDGQIKTANVIGIVNAAKLPDNSPGESEFPTITKTPVIAKMIEVNVTVLIFSFKKK